MTHYHELKPTSLRVEEVPGAFVVGTCRKCGDKIVASDISVREDGSIEINEWREEI